MLNQLHVQNFALIQNLKLELKQGLNIITGETGAGKSILLDALSLLCGKRADLSIIRKGEKKCIVEAEFSLLNYDLETFFSRIDVDFEEPTIIRREISATGKSRSFINDTPVNLSILKDLGERIIDIHSQHSNLILSKPDFAFHLLDNYGGNDELNHAYKNKFLEYIKKQKDFKELEFKQQQEKLNLEFNQFQLNELSTITLKEGEQESLEQESNLLNNAEEIKENGFVVVNNISNNSSSVQELLQASFKALEKLSKFDKNYKELEERLFSCLIEVKDISDEVQNKIDQLNLDFSRIQEINEKLDFVYALQKKYNVSSTEQLIQKRDALQKLVNSVVGGDEILIHLAKEIEELKFSLIEKAELVSKQRQKDAPSVSIEIIKDLKLMGIIHPQLEFKFSRTELNKYGIDQIDSLFSANKGNPLGKIDKNASGGELSRLMLSIKKNVGSKTALPSIVFDEIDTGVSGEVAGQMGKLMREMSENMQVITITHLPQIAAQGDVHYKVFKSEENNQVSSQIKQLDNEARIEEIAQMLSGVNVSKSARENAMELLSQK
tara:strand:+ start:786 stop:2441 length:1656 start_codon:yes stop_codon:yes gene_type:complete